jgi:hypothetical protein
VETAVPQDSLPDWIPFDEGNYMVQRAFLVSAAGAAVALENSSIHITTGRAGRKHLQGTCMVRNMLVVDLLDDTDTLDILLDLGEEFTFLLEMPDIQAGKVFSPGVKSTFRFFPVNPWKQLSREVFNDRLEHLTIITGNSGSE